MRASRLRLTLAADGDRRRLERVLHDGLQQRLVALAVELQLLEASLASEAAETAALIAEMKRDLQLAVGEATELAERIYPSSLDSRGLAVALRSAAARAGTPARVEVDTRATLSAEALVTIYWALVAVLDQGGAEEVTVSVAGSEDHASFEIVASRLRRDVVLDPLRDRVDALGGQISIDSVPGKELRVAGSLPLRVG